ncbi:protein MIZU-KUSSEI 1 [Hibiscus syriacus]|uniref:protein MIZU-KUSSEI 1 n=1 Tax=Hibiscus syriacus TaxID=106335 RepID=UPI0019250163|nr:protein MIZU-KUSSEI 1 [Hibiscus syriacus]
MAKIDVLRRLLPCLTPTTASSSSSTTPTTTTATPIKKRLSTSLRDDHLDTDTKEDRDSQDSTTTMELEPSLPAFSRPSRSMVIGTIFGQRKGHVWFCIQHDRLSTKPSLLLELSIPTQQLVQEMSSGIVRIALECDLSELNSCPLHLVPIWTMHCNGRKIGFATKRKASHHNRLMLKTMQSTTVGAGMIPAGFGSSDSEEIMYMRANYEHVIGNSDYESFHLVNPDECSGQELSVFLMRPR